MSAVALQSFGFGDQLVRALDRDGEIWFVANDICAVLEIGNSRDAMKRLDDDEKGDVGITDAIGREQRTTIISESGTNALIFTSRKPAAKKFRKWVTKEVIPTIRRTGRYEMPIAANDAPDLDAPELPDDFEQERFKLAKLREIRLVYGLKRAREAWKVSGLLPPALAMEPPGPLAIGVIARLHQSVAEWMDARTEAAPGHREWAQDLYRDYLDWSHATEVPPAEMLTMTAFGRALGRCGIDAYRAGRVFRVGLRLVGKD